MIQRKIRRFLPLLLAQALMWPVVVSGQAFPGPTSGGQSRGTTDAGEINTRWTTDPKLAPVEQLILSGSPQVALDRLAAVVGRSRPSAQALLLRSTARIMLGKVEEGKKDLQQALKLDPSLQQGWLNQAGFDLAEERYDEAYEAFRKAQGLSPEDPNHELNLGTVRALQNKLQEATQHFQRFLQAHPGSGQAYYLVAGNYALGGFEGQAVDHLRKAIDLDERMRMQARFDDKFVLLQGPAYATLLNTDSYQPPAGAHTAAAGFRAPYSRSDRRLLDAVLEAMQNLGEPYDARVEATAAWALVWGDFRVRLGNQADGTGVLRLSAPRERFTAADWEQRTQALFRKVYEILNRLDRSSLRERRNPNQPPPG